MPNDNYNVYARRGRRWNPREFVPQAEAAQTMSVGNPAHGTINLGGFLRPRGIARPANADVLDPSYTPYKPAGFLRRLLGDRSNQLNEQYQQNLQRLLMEREVGRQGLAEEMALEAQMANAKEQQRVNNEMKLMQQRGGMDAAEYERRARQADIEKYGTEDPIALNALKEQERELDRRFRESQIGYNTARAFDALTPNARPPLTLRPGEYVQNPDGTYSKMPSEPSDIEQLGAILGGGGSGAQGSRNTGPVRGFVPSNLRKPLTPGASNGPETWPDGTPTAPPNISEAVTEPGESQRPTSAMADYTRSVSAPTQPKVPKKYPIAGFGALGLLQGAHKELQRRTFNLPRNEPSGYTTSTSIPTTKTGEDPMMFIDTEEDAEKYLRKPRSAVKRTY